jgi:hypothetical protein
MTCIGFGDGGFELGMQGGPVIIIEPAPIDHTRSPAGQIRLARLGRRAILVAVA